MSQYYDEGSGLWYEVNDDPIYAGGPTPPQVGGSDPGAPGGMPTTDPPPSPPSTSAPADPAAQTIIDYYNQYLGRAPQPGDVDKWLSGAYGWGDRNNLANIAQGIRLSDEGAQYSNQHTTPANTQPYTGFQTTGNDYSAFNAERTQDPAKSAKDAFVMFSNQAPAPPLGNKAAMAAWFNKYIAPGMNNLGHKVSSVSGDTFTYSNHEGTFTVDYAQNAGGPAGADRRLQWGAQPADAATAARYGGAAATGGTGGGGGGGGVGGGGGGGGYSGMGFSTSGNWPTLDVPSYTDPYGDYVPEKFIAPEPKDVYNDPSYQFRVDEGMKPITNQRALAGLTRGGATMKALQKYGQDFASDEFDRIYNRAKTTYDVNEGNRFNAFTTNKNYWNTGYGYKVNEAKDEFTPKFDAAKLEYGRDWDVYKFANDDAFRYYNADLNARTIASRPVD